MTPTAITPNDDASTLSDEGIEETFADALALLFSVPQVAVTARPGRVWTHANTGIRVCIPLTAKDENWTLQADAVWLASIFLADHLDLFDADSFKYESVLELGSGSGLLGLAIATRFPQARVVLSDYPDEGIINTLKQNIRLNNLEERVSALPLDWNAPETLRSRRFQTIIAADTLWNSQLHLPFCRTLRKSMTPDADIHIIAGLHTGRLTLQRFIETANQQGFDVINTMEYHVSNSKKRGWAQERPEETQEDAAHWLLYINMKRKVDSIN